MATPRTAVFVDMLGFGDLVEDNEMAVSLLDAFYAAGRSLEEILEDSEITQLERAFVAFHTLIDHDVKRALMAASLSSIVFSDSAFVVFEDSVMAVTFAQCVMRHMIVAHVPVRIGIAIGTFKGLRFSVDTGPAINLSSAQFLGSSIVRAHRVEACGYPGMRILLHPDFPMVREYRALECPIDEPLPESKKLKISVTKEVNYLNPIDDAVPPPELPGYSIVSSPTTARLFAAVKSMRAAVQADKKYQYDATLRAMNNMRKAWSIPDPG